MINCSWCMGPSDSIICISATVLTIAIARIVVIVRVSLKMAEISQIKVRWVMNNWTPISD